MPSFPPLFTKLLTRLRIPAIWLNAKMNQNAVYPDDRFAARQLTEKFLAAGFRDIVFINDNGNSHYCFFDRKEGYEEAMSRAGLTPTVFAGDHDESCAIYTDQFLPFFRKRTPNRAFICYAYGYTRALCAAASSAGRTPGADFKIATSGDAPVSIGETTAPTALMDEKRLPDEAVEMLTMRVTDPTADIPSVPIPYASIPDLA